MRFSSDSLPMSDSVFTLLRELIHHRVGLLFEPDKRDVVADRLSDRVLELGLSSFLDYYYLLKYDAAADEEWPFAMDLLTVQETFFWREVDQILALANDLAPLCAQLWPGQPLRIWSAACASGEEPLSIAMALDDAGWFERLPIEIYASDASARAIARARQGLYREGSFRTLPAHLKARYFTPEQGMWRVSPELQARVQWLTANVTREEELAALPSPQVVFCRNVFIYFSDRAIRSTVELFAKKTMRPAYLFVGAAESLMRITSDFVLDELGGAFVYVKRI
jgi:chemotaxis protein methyltransferase CheR